MWDKGGMTYRPQSDPTAPYADFRAAVKQFVQSKDSARMELADFVEAAPTTIDRWWLGTVTPRPATIEQVMKWIKAQR